MKERLIVNAMSFLGACALFTLAIGGTAYAHWTEAPELDPGTAASGLAMFVGGALLLIERHRRRR
jgi:hypothetical protein